MSRSSRASGAAALTVVLWASAFVAIRRALVEVTPGQLSLLRLSTASVAFAVVTLVRRHRPLIRRQDMGWLLLAGLSGMCAYQLLLNAGEQTVSAGTAALLVNVGPVFTVAGARLWFAESTGRFTWIGGGIALCGATLVAASSPGGIHASGGAALVLAAAVSQAAYFLIVKRLLAVMTPFDVTVCSTWIGTTLIVAVTPWLSFKPIERPSTWAAIVFLGLGPSAVGFLAWSYALRHLPLGVTTLSLYAVPAIAIVLGAALLDESPRPLEFIGGAVALAGVGIARRRPVSTAGGSTAQASKDPAARVNARQRPTSHGEQPRI